MISLSSPARRALIHVAYLAPFLTTALTRIYFAIQHIYFIHGNLAFETKSTFGLVADAFRECSALLQGSVEGTSDAVYFSYTVGAFGVIFWIALTSCTVIALAAAV